MFLSAEHETPRPIGQLAPWRGMRITRTSSAKFAAPELRSDSQFAGFLQEFLFKLHVAEGVSELVAFGRERVEILDRRELYGFEARFGARSAHDPRNMVWRACSRPETFIFSTIKGMSFSGVIIAFVS